MPRWIARASVSLSTPMPITNGSGEAYQSWNSDQKTAVKRRICAAIPVGLRPPVSASATSCSSSDGISVAVAAVLSVIAPPTSHGYVDSETGHRCRRPVGDLAYFSQPFSL